MTDVRPGPNGLVLRAAALEQGLSDGELARLVRRGDLVRVRRGAYVRRRGEDVVARHREAVAAALATLRVDGGVVSDVSAACLHGLPLWSVPLGRVHLTRRPPAGGSGSTRVRLHVARLPDDDVTVVDGHPVTTVTRTVVDLARRLPFESAVVAADAALSRRQTTPETLMVCLDRMGGVPGSRRARRALGFADGGGRSVGESRSRVLIDRLALPVPELQLRICRADGSTVGIADFAWRRHRTLAEFDGRVKYGRLLRPGQLPGDAVYEEKLREDELRDLGWQVARWTWRELETPAVVQDRLTRAFARGSRPA